MNFKILFFVICSVLYGCGVKSPPKEYPDTVIDSYIRNYTHSSDLVPSEDEKKEKPIVQ